jgi:hypothetical protein
MKTLEKYEAGRKIKPTEFHPIELKQMKIVRYLAKSGTAINKAVSFDLFDSIHKMTEYNGTVQAIGYRGLVPTILILKR